MKIRSNHFYDLRYTCILDVSSVKKSTPSCAKEHPKIPSSSQKQKKKQKNEKIDCGICIHNFFQTNSIYHILYMSVNELVLMGVGR